MLAIRYSRRCVLRFPRSIPHLHPENDVPHAESSSSSSRRHMSVSLPSNQSQSPGKVENATARKGHKSNFARRQIIANAKRLADALKDGSSNPPTQLPPSSDSDYWSDFLQTPVPSSPNPSPTLDDLLSKRPTEPPLKPWHSDYPRLYKRLYDSIHTAFVTKQLKSFARELGLSYVGGKGVSKAAIIKRIMSSWDWVEPRDEPKEPPPKTEVYELSSPELFLFLRDNSLIQRFAQYENLQLSVVRASEAPQSPFQTSQPGDENRMVLVAKGRNESCNTLRELLDERRKSIMTIEFSKNDVLGLEATVGLKYRATALSEEAAEASKRMLGMAALRTSVLPRHRPLQNVRPAVAHFLSHTPASSIDTRQDTYGLYPFFPSNTEPLPWDLSATTIDSHFYRLEKVKKWDENSSSRATEQMAEKMEDRLVSYPLSSSERGEKGQLKAVVEELAEGKGKLVAKFGHLLLPVMTQDKKSALWDSPLPGQWQMENLERWVREDQSRRFIFSPSLTPAMVQRLPFSSPVKLRRLHYRSLPSSLSGECRYLKFDFTLQVRWQDRFAELVDHLEKTAIDEVVESEIEVKAMGVVDQEVVEKVSEPVEAVEAEKQEVVEEASESSTIEDRLKGEMGTLKEVDLFLSDRPTDVQLIASAPVPLTNIPTIITSFFNASQASTESSAQPPVSLEIEGEVYHLEADEYIEEITQIEEGIVIKSVKATELNGRTIAYSEIESSAMEEIPSQFWRQLSNISRDITPEIASSRSFPSVQ
ncbi:hypothetical protein I305_06242 [Cryptococcus gattii E566]|uniref:Required for respiratory growth protein 9, mitochondrial n=1 Tax=Cryptococcus gattii EJB2 TaxID=1296103 RepID=A0ABR5BMR0_9TREE|nr:hypothetical protein I306_06079 [Cryptococcus gattii EJB2]KIY31337.1 hypothetical protein I305_06242 [Cryptococcus gattii E566]KJE01638.1 hypothetical protein I311_04675 [Cryptococcus gattii NT-10]